MSACGARLLFGGLCLGRADARLPQDIWGKDEGEEGAWLGCH
jgi:hypothetical protein